MVRLSIEVNSTTQQLARNSSHSFKCISCAHFWQSVLLVEETGEPEENHRPATSR